MFAKYLNFEAKVCCVVAYNTFYSLFEGVLVSYDDDSITLTPAHGIGMVGKDYKSVTIRKDTIISIGQI